MQNYEIVDRELENLHKIWAKYKSDVPLTDDLMKMRAEDASKEERSSFAKQGLERSRALWKNTAAAQWRM